MAAAAKAAESWRDASLASRTRVLFAFRAARREAQAGARRDPDPRARQGAADALGEVNRGLEVVEFACGLPQLLKGEFSENVSTDVDSYSIRQPLGVVAGITPFNFPAMVPMWMYPIAIACGNTLHPQALREGPLGRQLQRAAAGRGRPARGRLQRRPRRQGRGRRDPRPSRHRGGELRRLDAHRAATSTRRGTKNGKRVQALGGAKNHMVVLPDADLELAADSAVSAAYGSAGERCMAISVLVTVGDVADRCCRRSASASPSSRSRPATEPGAEMGPLVTKEHHAKVVGYVDKGEPRARSSSPTAATLASPATSRASSSARACSTT